MDEKDHFMSIKPREKFQRESSIIPRKDMAIGQYSRQTSIKNVVGQFRKQSTSVAFTRKDRQNHTHLIGSTGTGKSKFMELLMRQDMRDRKAGFCLIDPHGSLYDEILLYASHNCKHLVDRFVLFNPAEETEQILGFNPIPENATHNIDYVLDMLISGCLKAWGQDNTDKTPRITKWLENIFYTIIANELTLVETAPLLSISPRFKRKREMLLSRVGSDVIRDDWDMFHTSTNTQKQMLIEGASNRLRKFLRNEAIRNTIGQQTKRLDLQSIMDEGKILLVNLNGRERISYENTKLLGIMLVNEFFRVAKLRDPRDTKLRPFYLYVDEFANFITRDIARALEECRKFKLFLILAHQHLAQLKEDDEYLYASVLTNCKNKVVFGGLSKEDVQIMTDEISTGFVDLKSIKDEMYQTKVRHIEETRTVRGKSKGHSTGTTESQSRGTSESHGTTEGTAHSHGTTHTSSTGGAHTTGTSEARGETETIGTTTGHSDSAGTTEGESWGTNQSDTTGTSSMRGGAHTSGTSGSDTHGYTDGTSSSDTHGDAHTNSSTSGTSTNNGYSRNSGDSRNLENRQHTTSDGRAYQNSSGSTHNTGSSDMTSHSHTNATSHSENHSHTDGWNTSETENWSDSQSQSHTHGTSHGGNRSSTNTHTNSSSQSETQGKTHTQSQSQSDTENWSTAQGQSQSDTRSQSHSETHGTNESTTHGTSQTHSTGESESIVPFMRPEEYKELTSRTFWSKDELLYMELSKMKNQGTGQAFIKIGAKAPIETNIEHVKPVPYNPRFSPKRIEAFRESVFTKNGQYYTPTLEARLEYEERQRLVFGEPLRFDERALVIGSDEVIEEEEGLFNE